MAIITTVHGRSQKIFIEHRIIPHEVQFAGSIWLRKLNKENNAAKARSRK